MLANLLRTVFPTGCAAHAPQSVAEKHSLYLAQQSARHHFDSLRLALGVLECDGKPLEQAEWLLRVEEAADKCAAAIDECASAADLPS